MNKLLDLDHGVESLLASIVVLMCFQVFWKVGEFLWTLIKRKSELSDKSIENLTLALTTNTSAVEKLESRIVEVEQELSELPKFKSDLSRLFVAVKEIAGKDKWTEIRKIIMEDGF